MSLPYTKMSGAGNTFIVIEERCLPEGTDPGPLVPTLCAEGQEHGGADGLIVVGKGHRDNYFEMKYYNRDGSAGMMCGNGGRCAVQYAVENGLVREWNDIFFTNADVVYPAMAARIASEDDPPPDLETLTPNHVYIWFPDPRRIELGVEIDVMGAMRRCHFIDVGTPHAVFFIDEMGEGYTSVDDVDVAAWGAAVRNHERFQPEGANANFVEIMETEIEPFAPRPAEPGEHRVVPLEQQIVHTIRLRTFERGVEAETGACGTGALASALAASKARGIAPPFLVITSSGEELDVDFDPDIEADGPGVIDYDARTLSLGGYAEVVMKGEFTLAW